MAEVVEVLDSIMGSGKALLNGTSVVTSRGYKTIESLVVGDKVYGEDGNLHSVLGVYPQGKKSLYRVTFSDRNSIICCDEHLWTYQHPQDKAKGVFRTAPLKEIMKMPLFKETSKGKNWQFHIPVTKPVHFSKKELPIDPYLLGLMLGDGCFGDSMSFTNSEEDLVDKFKGLVKEEVKGYERNGTTSYRLKRSGIYKKFRAIYDHTIRSESKFIPTEYLTSSLSDRINLIKGLIDTDGFCSGGYFEYSTSSKQMAEDMEFILESVGCTVTRSIKSPKYSYNGEVKTGCDSYRLFIRHDDLSMLCSSEKHLSRIKPVNTKPNRTIRSIEYYGEGDCTCIMVDNPTKLFLTEHFIPTHNTTQVIKWMEEHHEEKYIYVSPLLSEVGDGGRLSQAVSRISFAYPTTEDHDTKSDHLLELLSNGENIACTHSLYMSLTNEHLDLVEYHGYTVVIDEEINVIEGFDKYSVDDYMWLYSNDKVSVDPHDGMLSWVCDQPVGKAHKYYMLKQYCDSQCLYVAKRSNVMMVTQLPIRLMTVAKRVVILTYMFEGNILDRFLKLKGVESKPFEEVQVGDVSKDVIRDLIELVEPKVDLSISTGLSSSWYKRASQAQLDVVGKYIRSVAMKYKATPDDLMYTIPKERHVGSKNLVKPKGYYRKRSEDGSWSYCWLPVQTRATNDYADKSVLVHCYDRYPMVSVESYLQDYGYPISREVFALSEMLQWVWRSRIRKGEKIVLAIASKRMYSLFKDWLNKD